MNMFLKFFNKKNNKNNSSVSYRANHGLEIDPEMKYCPSCGDEYRSDMARCGVCDEALVRGEEKIARMAVKNERFAGRTMDISHSDELVTIQKGLLKDIKVLRTLLAQERIPAMIAGGDEAGCRKSCCGPEMVLQIKKQDIEAAAEVITRDFVKSTALDTHDISGAAAVFNPLAKETVCPACGCRFSPAVGACPDCGLSFE